MADKALKDDFNRQWWITKRGIFFAKNAVILRDETEWTELTELKYNALAGANKDKIVEIYRNFDFNQNFSSNLYGDGKAASVILQTLKSF